jgi:hypothetical protein
MRVRVPLPDVIARIVDLSVFEGFETATDRPSPGGDAQPERHLARLTAIKALCCIWLQKHGKSTERLGIARSSKLIVFCQTW